MIRNLLFFVIALSSGHLRCIGQDSGGETVVAGVDVAYDAEVVGTANAPTNDWTHAGFLQQGVSCQACHTSQTTFSYLVSPYAVPSAGGEVDVVVTNNLLHSTGIRIGKINAVPFNDELMRAHLPIEDEKAILVVGVPEEDTSLERGDIVLSIAGKELADLEVIQKALEKDRGASVTIDLIRKGKAIQIKTPAEQLARPETPYRIGLQVEPPGDALRAQLNLYENEGLLVTDVIEDSPAEAAEIKTHDILLRAGTARLSTFQDLKDAVNASKGKALQIVLMRGGKEQTVSAVPVQQAPTQKVEYRWDVNQGVHGCPGLAKNQMFSEYYSGLMQLQFDAALGHDEPNDESEKETKTQDD